MPVTVLIRGSAAAAVLTETTMVESEGGEAGAAQPVRVDPDDLVFDAGERSGEYDGRCRRCDRRPPQVSYQRDPLAGEGHPFDGRALAGRMCHCRSPVR